MEHGRSTSQVRGQLRGAARTQANPTAQHAEVEVGQVQPRVSVREAVSTREGGSVGAKTEGNSSLGWKGHAGQTALALGCSYLTTS